MVAFIMLNNNTKRRLSLKTGALPCWSGLLPELTVFTITQNRLTSLQCLDAFRGFTVITATTNMITSVPIIPSWITGINLNDNPLTDISAIG
jgi:hypothetical protein